MKKYLIVLLALVLMLTVISCGKEINVISEEEAKNICFKDCGVEDSLSFSLEESAYIEGVYIVKFTTELYLYKYELIALDGEIIYKGYEDLNTGDSKYTIYESKRFITKEKAKEFALKACDIQSDVNNYRCELEKENEKYIYKVSFDFEKKEYDVKVNAFTGEIVK